MPAKPKKIVYRTPFEDTEHATRAKKALAARRKALRSTKPAKAAPRPGGKKSAGKPPAAAAVKRSKAARPSPAADSSDSGILAAVANFTPNAVNTVTAQPGFVARAVVMPPGTVAGVPQTQFTVVAYVTQTMGAAQLKMPNVSGILVVDLPDGMLPPPGGGTIYDAINAAIMDQLSPDPPGGTGNDKPPTTP